MTTLDQALAQMRAAGMPDFPPDHPKTNTDRIQRYGPKKKAWYRLYEYRARNNRYYIVGAYGMWGEIEPPRKIETDWTGIDEDERERIQRSQAELEAKERAKRQERAKFAEVRAVSQWDGARKSKPEGVETYLDRKGVAHEKGIRYLADGTLLVPMIRYDVTEAQESAEGYTGPRRLIGLQKIAPDGTKRFNKGVAMEGAACRLGPAPKAGDIILLTEGLATGLTLRMAIDGKYAVYVAFNAGNIPPAAAILRKLFPASPILFCADDDAYLVSSLNKLLRENFGAADLVQPPLTECAINTKHGPGLVSADWTAVGDGVPGLVGAMRYPDRIYALARQNAGRTYAHRSAAAVGNAAVVYPVFAARKLPPDPDVDKLTDYNDLHKAEGLEVVRHQLAAELERLQLSIQVRNMVKEAVRETKRETKAKPEKQKPQRPVDWDAFFKRFTLIYPTDTVWDAVERKIVKIAHVKIAFGDGVVKAWLDSPSRRMVMQEQVVFDPSEKCPEECINLFNGIELKPVAGACTKLLELLQHLCGEADQDQCPVMDWVLKWLAYPLQHPGAKLETAVVMHGAAEGTGKNLFFRAVRAIYGEYASLITQAELESPYNAWISQRLFIIANEVISRAEMKHHVGKLKNYITESPLPIRDLYMPLRYEDNHMNAVFLTNDLHALQISPGDRRYMVIRTPGGLTREYYNDIVAELAAGGAAALYQKLLELPLGDFDEHTKPLLTPAKEDLIEQSYNSAQFFQAQLKNGEIGDAPYGPCLVRDLYELYLGWCPRVGHRNPLPLNRFSHEFMAMNGVRRIDKARVVDPERPEEKSLVRSLLRQKAIFVMGARPEDKEESAWHDEGVAKFREAMMRFLRLRRSRDPSGDGDPGWHDDPRR
jgi:putative DNA primase/helicase